jgi:1-acyl-sn-glycerol-3-phosphate acyltransferase
MLAWVIESHRENWVSVNIICDVQNFIPDLLCRHKMIPIFGWMEQFVEFIFVKRNWQEDRSQLEKGLCNLISYPKPFWFIIFPEGTRFNKARMEENQRWSRENGRKPLSHVLWPRAKAFLMTVESLGKTIDACYDATLAFERDVSFFDMLRGRGNTVVHFHVKRYSMAKLHAMSADALTAWLDERWVEKEALLEKFARDRSYGLPEVKSEKPMPSGRVVAAWLLCLLVILSRIPLVRGSP